MYRRRADLFFLLASLAGVGGIIASLRGTHAMTYVAFGLLGVGAALVTAGVVVDRVRSGSSGRPLPSAPQDSHTAEDRETMKVGNTRQ